MARIPVPTEAVRTAEQLLAGVTVIGSNVWLSCGHCGGSGNYPSSLIPAGRCRFYCWQNRTLETYGKLPVPVDTYIKRAQADDRRAYRAQVQWELDAPKRAEAERLEAERQATIREEEERLARADAERRAISQWQGEVGGRLDVAGRVVLVRSFQQKAYAGYHYETRFVTKVRDAAGNVFVWFSGNEHREGETLRIRGTVKEHGEYQGEKQTTLQRVKEL